MKIGRITGLISLCGQNNEQSSILRSGWFPHFQSVCSNFFPHWSIKHYGGTYYIYKPLLPPLTSTIILCELKTHCSLRENRTAVLIVFLVFWKLTMLSPAQFIPLFCLISGKFNIFHFCHQFIKQQYNAHCSSVAIHICSMTYFNFLFQQWLHIHGPLLRSYLQPCAARNICLQRLSMRLKRI